VQPPSHAEVVARGRKLIARYSPDKDADPANFLEFAAVITDIVKAFSARQRRAAWVRPFIEAMRELEGDFTAIVEKDPMMLYKPAHEVAMAFHQSMAKVRYNCSANRTSKSQTGYAEHYYVVTGQHKWRYFLPPAASTFLIGVNFSKYGPAVFERKLVRGEPGNILAPMFPEGGKWFYHYNDRKHVLTVSCPECANKGHASTCKHPKSTITLFSDQEGPDVLQGRQDTLGHFDEHVSEEFFDEGMERLKSVDHSSMIITAVGWCRCSIRVQYTTRCPAPRTRSSASIRLTSMLQAWSPKRTLTRRVFRWIPWSRKHVFGVAQHL